MSNGFIYGVVGPCGRIRYVGQSVNPQNRFRDITDLRKPGRCGPLLRVWIARNIGRVRLRILEETDKMDEKEVEWIAKLRAENIPLLNIQNGGKEKYTDVHSVVRQIRAVREQWERCVVDPSEWEIVDEVLRLTVASSSRTRAKERRFRKR